MTNNEAMRFVADFLALVNSQGIYDEFDKASNKMKTSTAVETLIKRAKVLLPELGKGQAAKLMRDLTEDERSESIAEADNVIDLRDRFRKDMSVNGGARGLLEKLVKLSKEGTVAEVEEVLKLANEFVEKSNES